MTVRNQKLPQILPRDPGRLLGDHRLEYYSKTVQRWSEEHQEFAQTLSLVVSELEVYLKDYLGDCPDTTKVRKV